MFYYSSICLGCPAILLTLQEVTLDSLLSLVHL